MFTDYRTLPALFAASLLALPGCAATQVDAAKMPEGEVQHVVRAGQIKWEKCPPSLPESCEMAVLEGDPDAEEMFTLRLKISDVFLMRPHWHPSPERVTVLSGAIGVGFGDTVDRRAGKLFGPGDYYVNQANVNHFVWADGPALVQITGIGPWKVNFIHPEPE